MSTMMSCFSASTGQSAEGVDTNAGPVAGPSKQGQILEAFVPELAHRSRKRGKEYWTINGVDGKFDCPAVKKCNSGIRFSPGDVDEFIKHLGQYHDLDVKTLHFSMEYSNVRVRCPCYKADGSECGQALLPRSFKNHFWETLHHINKNWMTCEKCGLGMTGGSFACHAAKCLSESLAAEAGQGR